jgi:predicted GNAT family acetyltransferase
VFERTLVDGYPLPEMQPHEWGGFYDERVLGGPTRFWVGFVDGHPVATAAAHVASGVNNVEMVATLEGFRGRGYGAAVTWAATTADPSLPAILIASDPGRPVYERLGYTALTRWTMWLRP